MGYLSPEKEKEFRNRVNKPVSREIPESPEGRDYGNILGRAYRGAVPFPARYALKKAWPQIDRTLRLLGLPVAVGASTWTSPGSLTKRALKAIPPEYRQRILGFPYEDPKESWASEWVPDIVDYPGATMEAAKAAAAGWEEGMGLGSIYDTTLDTFHEEVGGGPGFWGTAEAVGSMLPTPGMFATGAKVISKAPTFGRFAGKYLPGSSRVITPIVEAGAKGVGRSLQFPLEAEQAFGRAAGRVLGLPLIPIRKGLEKFRGRPAAKVATPPRPPVTPGARAAVGTTTRKLFHGTRDPNPESFIDRNGNLVLRASKNFEGKQIGVSFSESQDTALDYASRVPGQGPVRSRAQGAVFEIDADAIPAERLFIESGEEIATRGAEPVIIQQGKFRIIKDVAARTELEKWEAAQIARVKTRSNRELGNEYITDILDEARLEWESGGDLPLFPGRRLTELQTDITAKYGKPDAESFPVHREVIRRIRTSSDPEKVIKEITSEMPPNPIYYPDTLARELREEAAKAAPGAAERAATVGAAGARAAREVLEEGVDARQAEQILGPPPISPVTRSAKGRSYEQAQQAIDDYETTLMGRYSEKEVLEAPIYSPLDRTANEDYRRLRADLRRRTPLTNQELQELSELYKARDAIGKIEDAAALESAMSKLKPSTLKGPASLEDISDVVKEVSESTRRTAALHPRASLDTENTVAEIYNKLAWKQYNRAPNIAMKARLENQLSIDEVGANPQLARQARAIVEDIMGPPTAARIPTVAKDVPLNKVVPDNEAGPIVSSADPSPPNPKFDPTPEQAFEEMANLSSPEELAAMDAPKFRNLLRRLDLIGRARGLVGMREMPHIYDPIKPRPLHIMQTIMRLHEGAINAAQVEAKRIVKGGLRETDLGEPQLRALGMSVSSGDREIILESAIPRMNELNKALHDSTKPIPKGLDRLYEELKNLADWEEIARINFDPTMKTIRDYWYRGWKATKALLADRRKVKLGAKPKFKIPRRDASYEDMISAGYEPLSWNPFEQWRLSRMQGIRYRQQMALVWYLKKTGLWRPSSGSTDEVVEGIIDFTADGKPWRTPNIGPAFEGKPITIADNVLDEKGIETGETIMKQVQAHRGVVHPDIAKRLESTYGEPPAGWEELGPLDMIKIIDKIVFVPKRFKLFSSFFQQFDFLQRGVFGTSGHVMERLKALDPIGAAKVGLKWPKSAVNVIRANFSPGYRQVLKRKLGSTDPLVPGRPGIHWKGLMEAGLSLYDYSIFPPNIGDIARSAAEDVGMLGFKKVKNLILKLETMMRNGLFDGTYPASIMADVENNIAPVMVRKWGHLTDAQINGAIVETVNKAYSTLPKNQSVLQNRFFRGFFQRYFFSINEAEGLLRQATGAFTGPHAEFWRTRWLGAYVALMAVGNTIHMVSTGLQGKPEHLPWDRWVPISQDNFGPFPFSYRRDFAAPNIPIKGRGAVELTLDLVMQADTVFRLLNPASFLTSRESVPIRALQNQIFGRDFYGSSITDAGPMGLWSRMASLINDMFVPIGAGQSLVNIAQEKIPGVSSIIPPGAQRVGVPGQIIKGTGLNVRAETTLQYKNRMARESGLINPDTGEPVQTWDELLPGQEDQIERMVPGFQVELQRRSEILAQRGSKYAEIRIDVQKHENDLINKANAISKKRLEVSLTSGDYDPESARKEIGEAENDYYNQVYGIIWDKEKERFTGGIYDEDKDFEEPEDDTTVDHALWKYRKIFLDARDEKGNIDYTGYSGVILNKALNEFWVGLDKRLVPEVINNIRLIEGKYSPEMQVMQDAGRYGISLRLTVGATRYTKGETLGYYDLENHKNVETYIVKMTGISRAVIRQHLDKTSSERKAARRTEQGADIGKYLDKAVRRNGELWKLREEFVNRAPSQWLQAMFEGGYDYQDKRNIEQKGIEEKIIKEGKTLPRLNYKQLYMDVLPRQ